METLGHKANRWHHSLAQITGSLSLRIGRHSFHKKDLVKWAESIEHVAKEMREVALDKENAGNI